MKRTVPLILVLLFAAQPPAQGSNSAKQIEGVEGPRRTASSSPITTLVPSQIFSRARPSVVVNVASDQNGQREALGSGFIMSHGRIATNHHVVEGMNQAYVVFSDGAVKPVSGIVADSLQQDLIILAVETGNRPSLTFGDEMSLQQGDSVYALGAPKGLELSFTNGIVSSFRKSEAQFLIQTTAPIAPGSSGGPLFDRTGRVVGVTTSMLSDAPGIYFSVAIGDLKRLLRTPQVVALSFEEWVKRQASTHPSGTHNKDEPSEGPPLRDTISWMQNFSQLHGMRDFNGKPSIRIVLFSDTFHEKTSAPGCAIWEAIDYFQFLKGSSTADVELFDLSDINPDSVNVVGDGVVFEIADGSGKVYSKSTSDPTMTSAKLFASSEVQAKSEAGEGGFVPIGRINLDSPESNERFASAFKHAVILCGGVKSTF
jgi:Trypsin-like peptidase domain